MVQNLAQEFRAKMCWTIIRLTNKTQLKLRSYMCSIGSKEKNRYSYHNAMEMLEKGAHEGCNISSQSELSSYRGYGLNA